MKVSKDAKKGAKALYSASLSNGLLDEAKIRLALSKTIERRPSGYGQILHEYHRLVRLEVERRTAIVESATNLSKAEETKIESVVRERLGSDVRAVFHKNSELIGGVRIRIGSHVYESSVRERLARLKWDLAH